MPFDRSKPVLVVDDNYAIIRIVTALLRTQGITDVEGTGSGPDAIRRMAQRSFSMVICDYFMMPMNGIDLKLLMDRRNSLAAIPFVLMTTREETYDRAKFERANIRNLILKPFTAASLVETMDRAAEAIAVG